VERAHTLPHHGSYSVGKHSFDAVSLLLVLHPNPSLSLVKAVLWHDVAERWTGDVPATAKWSSPQLKSCLEELEDGINDKLQIPYGWNLTQKETWWLRSVDRIELLLWAKEQVMLGNENAKCVVNNLAEWFRNNPVPDECQAFLEAQRTERTPDEIPQ
jgi:5'-deoxynucleotidase YfbR-like HD superfamily hydrolase